MEPYFAFSSLEAKISVLLFGVRWFRVFWGYLHSQNYSPFPSTLAPRLTNSSGRLSAFPKLPKGWLGGGPGICCPEWAGRTHFGVLRVGRCWGSQRERPKLGCNSGHYPGPLRLVSSPVCDSPEISDNHRHQEVPGT